MTRVVQIFLVLVLLGCGENTSKPTNSLRTSTATRNQIGVIPEILAAYAFDDLEFFLSRERESEVILDSRVLYMAVFATEEYQDYLMLFPEWKARQDFVDRWGNSYRFRCNYKRKESDDDGGVMLVIHVWSCGLDGVDNGGTGDDIVSGTAELELNINANPSTRGVDGR